MESNEIKYTKEEISEEIVETIEERKYRRDHVKNRFFKLLGMIFNLADIAGIRILNRLEIQDKKTGRVFK